MSLPTPAKRRHFDRKREQDASNANENKDEEEDEDEEEEAWEVRRKKKLDEGDDDEEAARRLSELSSARSSVNAKIGHFERLLNRADERVLRFCRQSHLIEASDCENAHTTLAGLECGASGMEVDLDSDEHVNDELEEEYLGLDTIVEEDEELGACAGAGYADDALRDSAAPDELVAMNCDKTLAGAPIFQATGAPLMKTKAATMTTTSEAATNLESDIDERADKENNHGQQQRHELLPPVELTAFESAELEDFEPSAASGEEEKRCQEKSTAAATKTTSENNNDNEIPPLRHRDAGLSHLNGSSGDLANGATNFQLNQQKSSAAMQQAEAAATANNMRQQQHQQQQQKQAPAILLPSTNRLISEHQARQQQALFRVLAERQKLLDELGPDERQQQADLMSSLPASWTSTASRPREHSSKRRSRATSKSGAGQQQASFQLTNCLGLKLNSAAEPADGDSRSSRGVPLSAVDLSSVSDHMLDELLGHIASASSSSSAGSLDSSEISSASSTQASSSVSSSESSSSSDHDESAGPAGLRRMAVRARRQRSSSSRNHSHQSLASSGQSSSAQQHRLELDREASGAPSVIGVHDELHEQQAGSERDRHSSKTSRKCREAYKKSRRRRNGDDDDQDGGDHGRDRRNPGELQVNTGQQQSNGTGQSRAGGGGGACSLSPAADSQTRKQEQERSSSATKVEPPGRLARRAREPGQPLEPAPRSGLSSSISLSTSEEPSSMSLHELVAPYRDEETSPIVNSSSISNQNSAQSVEAILGRMLEALQEVGAQQQQPNQRPAPPHHQHDQETGPAEEQEQLNELLERGFLHLEQLLNCNLSAPGLRAAAAAQQAPSEPHQPAPRATSPRSHAQVSQTPSTPQVSAANKTTSLQISATNGGGGATPSFLLSKDSDYGSDTQSADCLSHSTSSDGATSVVPSPQQQQQQSQSHSQHPAGLSPLAIELSFKLAESLRKLAQQQPSLPSQAESMATNERRQAASVNTSDVGTGAGTRAAPKRQAMATGAQARAPWRSVVMINSPSSPSCSSSVSRPHSSQSTASSSCDGRNMTPPEAHETHELAPASAASGADSRPESQQSQRLYKTCVNVNLASTRQTSGSDLKTTTTTTTNAGASEDSSERRESNQLNRPKTKSRAPQPPSKADECVVELPLDNRAQTQVVKVVSAPHCERRPRSSFRQSSLRRRPSFSGSTTGAARPGSPVPRSQLADREILVPASAGVAMKQTIGQQQQAAAGGEQEAASNKMRQLQRALVLAQKYDYSPAKLAASKLGAKLQLAPSQHKADGLATAQNQEQEQKSRERLEDPTSPRGNFVTGQVQLEILYFAKSGSLTVHLLQCAHLTPVSKRRTTSNPYVKLYLLPDRSKQGKRKSSVKRHQLEPKFNERFTFGPLQLADFDERLLWLSVWHKDRGLGRNELLGELLLPLAQVRAQLLASDLCQATPPKWYPLHDRPLVARAQDQERQQSSEPAGEQPNKAAPLTMKRVPQSNGNLSLTLARPTIGANTEPRLQKQQAAELVAKKLSEFEQKAALLAQRTAPLAPSGANRGHETLKGRPMAPLGSQPAAAAAAAKGRFSCMQVTAGFSPADVCEQFDAGQLFVALKFVPDSGELRRSARMEGRLHVLIKEARDIGGAAASQAPPSAYCKCYLLDAFGQRLTKQKTGAVKRTSSPRWDHECQFGPLQLDQLTAQALEIVLLNRDSLSLVSSGSGERCLGAIRLCQRLVEEPNAKEGASEEPSKTTGAGAGAGAADLCSERESRLWMQMMARPNIWVYGELPLRRQLRPLVQLGSGGGCGGCGAGAGQTMEAQLAT